MSKLEELGGMDCIRNGRPQLLHGDQGCRWAGNCIDALLERIEELEREEKESRREIREMAAERGIVFPKEDEIPVSSMACDLLTCIDGRDKLIKNHRVLMQYIEAKVHECLKVVDK